MSSIDLLKASRAEMFEICKHFGLPCRTSWNKSNLADLILKNVDKTTLSQILENLGIVSTAVASTVKKQGGAGCDRQSRNDVVNLAKSLGITDRNVLKSNRKIICDAIAAHLQSGGSIPSQPTVPTAAPHVPSAGPTSIPTFAPHVSAAGVSGSPYDGLRRDDLTAELDRRGVTSGYGRSDAQKKALLKSLDNSGGFIPCDPPHTECGDGYVCDIKVKGPSNCVSTEYADKFGETKVRDHSGKVVVTKPGYTQAIINGKRVIGTKAAMDKLVAKLQKGGGTMPTSLPRSSHSHPSAPTAIPTTGDDCPNRAIYSGLKASQLKTELQRRQIPSQGTGKTNIQKADLLCALDETGQVPCSQPDLSCPGNFVCDANNNYCVTEKYTNEYFKNKELYINGNQKVIGTVSALNSLKSKLKQQNIPFSDKPFTIPSSQPTAAPTVAPPAPQPTVFPPSPTVFPPSPTVFPPSPTVVQPAPTVVQPAPTLFPPAPTVVPPVAPTVAPADSVGVIGDQLSGKQEMVIRQYLANLNCLLDESVEELIELINLDCIGILKGDKKITQPILRQLITKAEMADIHQREEDVGNKCRLTHRNLAEVLELLRTSSLSTPVGDIPSPVIQPTEPVVQPAPFVPPVVEPAPFVPPSQKPVSEPVSDPVVSPTAWVPPQPSPAVSVHTDADTASEADIEQILAAIQSGDSAVLDKLSGSRREVLDCLGLLG